MNLATVLAAIEAGVSLIPQGAVLVGEVKALFSATDQAQIDAAVVAADAAADAQHTEAQGI